MKNKSTKTEKIILGALILISYAFLFFCCSYDVTAQTTDSKWEETQIVEIPFGLEVFQGFTRNGNPKYWFEIDGNTINVSESNAHKYLKEETTLVLVEWYNKSTNKYKYTIRQKKVKNTSNNKLNLDALW